MPATFIAIATLTGCATTTSATTDHSRAAAQHEELSEQHLAQYELAWPNSDGPGLAAATRHQSLAAIHERHRAEHAHAAGALAEFARVQCPAVTLSEPTVCPLGYVSSVSEFDGGVRLRPVNSSDATALLALARCHAQFAASSPDHAAADCPFEVGGVRVSSEAGELIVTSGDAAAVQRIKELVRAYEKR